MPTLSQINLYYVLVFIFVISFSSFVLLLGFTLYTWLHEKKILVSEPDQGDPRDAAYQEAIGIVDSARKKAMDLLNQAQAEAKGILHDSEEVHSSTKEMVDQKIQEIAQKHLQAFDMMSNELFDSYKSALSQEREASLRNLTGVSNAFKEDISAEIRSFSESLRNLTNETESTVRGEIKGQYDQLSSEIANLARALKEVAEETEGSLKLELQNQYGQVKQEVGGLAERLRGVVSEVESTIKDSLLGEYEKVKQEVGGLAENLRKVTEETEGTIKQDITQEYEQAKGVVHEFAEHLREATVNTEESLKRDITDEYNQIKSDLHKYKDEKLQTIDRNVSGIIEEVARDVIGKTMTAKDHEELILRSLEKIKSSTNFKDL